MPSDNIARVRPPRQCARPTHFPVVQHARRQEIFWPSAQLVKVYMLYIEHIYIYSQIVGRCRVCLCVHFQMIPSLQKVCAHSARRETKSYIQRVRALYMGGESTRTKVNLCWKSFVDKTCSA